jgi:hypothetical protein
METEDLDMESNNMEIDNNDWGSGNAELGNDNFSVEDNDVGSENVDLGNDNESVASSIASDHDEGKNVM